MNYGAGVNSTAMLVEAHRRGEPVDVIFFSYTGSEHPGAYWEDEAGRATGYLPEQMDPWLVAHGMPRVTVVRWVRKRNDPRTLPLLGDQRGRFLPLHEWCEKLSQVPSKAFGKNFDGCSSKWKRQVIDTAVAEHPLVRERWARGEKVERWLGFDVDEPGRAARNERANIQDKRQTWCSPLFDWKMGREECEEAIERAGLPPARKSACWMCPSTKPHQILELRDEHPELLERALRMEARAIKAGNLGVGGEVRGLGSRLNWADYLEGKQPAAEVEDVPCGCFDGGE